MYPEFIYISSLGHNDIVNEFDNVLKKEKYACFPAPDMMKIGTDLWLLALPFNKHVHWFLAQETANDGKVATLSIIDKHVLKGIPASKVISLPVRERGLLDNTGYSFYGDVDRNDSDLKVLNGIRKNSMGDYDFGFSHENVFKITPRKSHAKF